jgi:hypothetical protein
VRKSGTVQTEDPKAQKKKPELNWPMSTLNPQDCHCGVRMKRDPELAIPQPGENWHPEGKPTLQPHEDIRGGTAKLLTLFRPATGVARSQGVLSAPNAILHPWLKQELQSILDQ